MNKLCGNNKKSSSYVGSVEPIWTQSVRLARNVFSTKCAADMMMFRGNIHFKHCQCHGLFEVRVLFAMLYWYEVAVSFRLTHVSAQKTSHKGKQEIYLVQTGICEFCDHTKVARTRKHSVFHKKDTAPEDKSLFWNLPAMILKLQMQRQKWWKNGFRRRTEKLKHPTLKMSSTAINSLKQDMRRITARNRGFLCFIWTAMHC